MTRYGETTTLRIAETTGNLHGIKRLVRIIAVWDREDKPFFLFTTDLTLTLVEILELYAARFEAAWTPSCVGVTSMGRRGDFRSPLGASDAAGPLQTPSQLPMPRAMAVAARTIPTSRKAWIVLTRAKRAARRGTIA